MTESIDEWTNQVHQGDAFELLDQLPGDSIHAVVTDPPYGMAFMPESNEWDAFDSPEHYERWCERWGRKALRVLKPGGHAVVCGGDRTHHRLYAGLEDAGFEIRHTLPWLFADNFPKDTHALLKPGAEFPVLARKPTGESVAANMEAHGVGALNVDACRIPLTDAGGDGNWSSTTDGHAGAAFNDETSGLGGGIEGDPHKEGRYPATVTLDGGAAALLDAQTGELTSGMTDFSRHRDRGEDGRAYGEYTNAERREERYYGDSGGASRFFYVAKADESERTADGRIRNEHATVKPVKLIEWHARLVTWPGQVVLDPFAGSGTTGIACRQQNREFVLFERNPEWCAVSRSRIGLDVEQPELLLDDDQPPLRAWTGGADD